MAVIISWFQENSGVVISVVALAFTIWQVVIALRNPKLYLGVSLQGDHNAYRSRTARPSRIHESLNQYTVPLYVSNRGSKVAENCVIRVWPSSNGAYAITANSDQGQRRDLFAIEAQDEQNGPVVMIRIADPIYTGDRFMLVSELTFIPSAGKYQPTQDPSKMKYTWQILWEQGVSSGEFTVDYSGWDPRSE